MKPLLFTLCLALLPLLFGLWVNTAAPYPPTRAYTATHCTRYCAAHGCRHATGQQPSLFSAAAGICGYYSGPDAERLPPSALLRDYFTSRRTAG